jgi:hypothetical protein
MDIQAIHTVFYYWTWSMSRMSTFADGLDDERRECERSVRTVQGHGAQREDRRRPDRAEGCLLTE